MVYCKKCGEKVDSTSKFCKNCGNKIATIAIPIQTTPIKKINYKWILWVIVIVCSLLLIVNLVSNDGSIRTSYNKEDKWWGTTHEKTNYGLFGKETETHSCPFWNRDC